MKPTNNSTVITSETIEKRLKIQLYNELKAVAKMEEEFPQIDWASIYFDKDLEGLQEAFNLWVDNFVPYINNEKKEV